MLPAEGRTGRDKSREGMCCFAASPVPAEGQPNQLSQRTAPMHASFSQTGDGACAEAPGGEPAVRCNTEISYGWSCPPFLEHAMHALAC